MCKRMISKILLAALLAQFAAHSAQRCEAADEQQTPPLPNIWDHLGSRTKNTGSFRILSEMRLADKAASFVTEEWADDERKLFRLDATPSQSDKQAGRRTLLINGESGERHIYEPFKCSLLAEDMLSKMSLTQLFPHRHEFVVAGLGAIWLYALAEGRDVTFRAANLTPATQGDADKRQRQTMRRVLKGYDKFSVDAGTEFPFRIELFFDSQGLRREDGGIDPETLVAIHLVEPQTSSIKLAAKIIEVNTQVRAAAKMANQADLFELPLGYGCIRADESKLIAAYKEQVDYKPPEDCYAPSGASGARVCNIEVVASLPESHQDDMDKWKTRTSSLRLSSGSLGDRAYVIQERREFARNEQTNASAASSLLARKSVVRRTKRIWALGKKSDVGEAPGEKALLFQMSEQMQNCDSVRDARLNEMPAIELPFALPPDEGRRAGNASSEDLGSKLIGGPSLGPDMMRELFMSTSDYHLIRANLAPWLKFRDVVQEKRINKFELRGNVDGQVIWAGPVSVVRRFFMHTNQDEEFEFAQRRTPADESDIHVDLYLFSKGGDQILSRIHLRLSPARLVDKAYLHRELDITACLRSFNRLGGNGELQSAVLPPFGLHSKPRGSISFVVTYPLDLDDQTAETLVGQEEQVYSEFVNNLISLSGQKLDPLQLSELKVDIEYDRIKVTATLHKWPELFSFTKTPKMRYSKATKKELLLASELKGSEADCAASCSHIGCASFCYCSRSKICDLAAQEPGDQADRLLLEISDESCNFWAKRQAKAKALDHALPAQVFNRMHGKILSASGDDDAQSSIAIPINLGAEAQNKTLLLIPNAINTQDNRLEESSLLINDDGHIAKSYDLTLDDPLDQSAEFVHVEFEVLFEGRKLVRASIDQAAFPFEEATHMDYDDCERFCRENDCKSFSHCRLEETCLISQLEQSNSIETNSEKDDFCYLLARMPLSKFHKIAGLSPASHADASQLDANNKTTEITRHRQSGSSRDCAIQCLDRSDESFTCRAFYFCPGTTSDCVLTTDRMPPVEVDEFMGPKTSALEASTPTCDLYQRSDIVEYNRLAGKELDPEVIKSMAGSALSMLLNLDADGCASECTHATADCIAFQVCSHSDHEKGVQQLRCAMLTSGFNATNPAKLSFDLMHSKLLRDAELCTTFVAKIQKLSLAHGRQVKYSGDSDSRSQGNSNWILSALFILIGMALGYAVTWLVVMRNPRLSGALMRSRR